MANTATVTPIADAVASITPIEAAPFAMPKVVQVVDKDQFKKVKTVLRQSGDFFKKQIQASMAYMFTQYEADNFAPLNDMRQIVATRKADVRAFESYVVSHINGNFKEGKVTTKSKAGKRTAKPVSRQWFGDKVTSDTLKAEAEQAPTEDAKEAILKEATKLEAREKLAAQLKVRPALDALIKRIEGKINSGEIDSVDQGKLAVEKLNEAVTALMLLATS